jgi:hypothetical protein
MAGKHKWYFHDFLITFPLIITSIVSMIVFFVFLILFI